MFSGRSAYWQKMISATSDPTFLLLTFLWHALYAWDEALENLYSHICSLEMAIIGEATQTSLVDELHILRAHQLHYSSLLESFKETVEFIRETPYPALQAVNTEERTMSELMMERECKLLLNEISRLNRSQKMQGKRLKNAINLVFSHIAIVDSRKTSVMTEVSVRDSSAMKQIAYLIMVFLPATFVATVFGMNVQEISPNTLGTLSQYFATALPITPVTIWIIIAVQSRYLFPRNYTFLARFGWPVLLVLRWLGRI